MWGPSWYRDRAGEERRLKDAVEAALKAGPSFPAQPVVVPMLVDFDELDLEAPPLWTEPYEVANISELSGRDIADPRASAAMRNTIVHVVQTEGPIVEDLLVKRVLGAWGVTSTERRRAAITRGLAALNGAGQS